MNMKCLAGAFLTVGGALVIVAGAGALAQSNAGQAAESSKEWPTYGHDPGGMRFSPLTEITPANVSRLKVAWVYHMRPAGAVAPISPVAPAVPVAPAGRGGSVAEGETPDAAPSGRGRGRGGSGFRPSQVTPLVIDGTMYLSTPYSRVAALEPATGKEIWGYPLPTGSPSTRGVEYWPGDAKTPAQIVFGSSDGKLYSLNTKTGKPNEAFGDNGIVNLNTPEILQGLPGRDALTSPPLVYKNLVITGGTTQENPPKGPAGDVRARGHRDRQAGMDVPFHSASG
jgi:quinoprotein glucose dehydrogenase